MIGVSLSLHWFQAYITETRGLIPAGDTETLEEFDMKVTHTYKVRDRAEDIARWLGLAGHDFEIASLCGLYHDLGRFEQAVRFGTMDDKITGSHADLSEEAFLMKAPRDGLSQNDVDIIAAALKCHNLFRIPGNLDEKSLLYARLTRDADKLDIFRYFLDVYCNREGRFFRFIRSIPEGALDPELIEAVLNRENFNASRVKSNKDRTLLEMSLVYDLNFGISFQKTLEMNFVESLAETLHDERLNTVAECANRFMRERLGRR